MRVEATPYVFRNDDRRQRFDDRRAVADDRRVEAAQQQTRARHDAHLWFTPAFGAHLLGQANPARVQASHVRRAYSQPEARTPLRPAWVAKA